MPPLITLTSDFGTRDSYVAEMKGVLLSEGPEGAVLTDLSHDLSPFNVHEAALFMRSAIPRFPRGSVHLVVVDPGVGGPRRAIIARVHGQTLVGPDNGVFGYLFDRSEEVWVLDPGKLGDRAIASTFHGRDLFAPAAARLAAGADPASLGAQTDQHQRMVFPLVEMHGGSLNGRVIHVDHFGNLVTNIPHATLRGFLEGSDPERAKVLVADRTVDGIRDHYAQAGVGELIAVVGSSGLLEVAAREQNAAQKLGAEVGMHVRVQT